MSQIDLGLHVAGVMSSCRSQSGLEQSKFGRWMLWQDTHEEYSFAVHNREAVTVIPVCDE
jgi:hypothetical protein